MSDDEKYQIIGKVVSDHEAAKKHLAALKAKGKSLAEFVHLVASALADEATWTVGREFTIKRSIDGRVTTADWPLREDIVALLTEIAETKVRIATLEQQRKDLGV